MTHLLRTAPIRFALVALLFVSVYSFGQIGQGDWGDALSDALVKWKTDCYPKGCLMQTDVLRGASENPPDASDFREYIGVDVGLDRNTRKPLYVAFHVDPNAQQDQGVFIAFTRTQRSGDSWKMSLDKDGASRVAIERCDEKSCMARVPLGLLQKEEEGDKMDLLDKFLTSDSMLVLYMKGGHPYRTMILLSSFKKEYERVLATELTAPAGK